MTWRDPKSDQQRLNRGTEWFRLEGGRIAEVRAYHLRPEGISKALAVAAHQRMRGLDPAACVAIGDSREDLAVAATVGTFWLVANAIEHDPGIEALARAQANVRIAEGAHGDGVYEAVVSTLAERGS